ncbi:MAG: 16S rRNA (cytosine(967)-C(5))-methyltransferase RsmB [Lachnospiraceae bacterium]|nr:16S rRNA (cytosine(967)-C(5))-methyltransferase RsmB [Lachnospiraceae bacterium]
MTNEVSAREIVLEMLLMVNKEGKSSHLVLNDVLSKYAYLPKNERSFIKRLFMGTLEDMYELDYIINYISSTRTNKMKPVILNLLRMAVYQIFYMDSVPDNAAVNEAVNLAGKRGFKNLKGFMNGVLRNIIRKKDMIDHPSRDNFDDYMEVKYSMPRELIKILLKDYSKDEIEEIGKASKVKRDVVIRVNTTKISVEDYMLKLKDAKVTANQSEKFKEALIVKDFDLIETLPGYDEGEFYVQDISSMEAIDAIGLTKGLNVVDVCAAPGGKSIMAAILMENEGNIISRDLSEYKADRIRENVERIGLDIIKPEVHDALSLDSDMVDKMDVVIADLPCSGIGVIAKKPDIKYNVNLTGIDELAALQEKILDTVKNYVKSGGRILFSTCTITKAENVNNTKAFLAKNPEFELLKEKQIMPSNVQDGFYYALMQRKYGNN